MKQTKQESQPETEFPKEEEIKYFLEQEFTETNITTGWVASHHSLRYHRKLTALSRLLLLDIITMSKNKGFCWACNRDFMDKFNVSKSTIKRAFRNLEVNHFIEREVNIIGHNNFRRKIFLNLETLKNLVSANVQTDEVSVGSNMNPGRFTDEPIIRLKNNSGVTTQSFNANNEGKVKNEPTENNKKLNNAKMIELLSKANKKDTEIPHKPIQNAPVKPYKHSFYDCEGLDEVIDPYNIDDDN